jgi:CRP-like cAMP-binding protein
MIISGANCTVQGFNDQCVGFITTYLRLSNFVPGDTIYERGERGNEMFFLIDGVVALHTTPLSMDPDEIKNQQGLLQAQPQHSNPRGGEQPPTLPLTEERMLQKGDIFGEGCLFPDELGAHRRERASAVSIVSVYALQASALLEIAEEYPEVCLSAEVTRTRTHAHAQARTHARTHTHTILHQFN